MAYKKRMRLTNDDKYRDELMEWLLDNSGDDESVSLVMLAKKLGLSRPTIYRFMYSDDPVSLKTLSVIRKFLKARRQHESVVVLTQKPSHE